MTADQRRAPAPMDLTTWHVKEAELYLRLATDKRRDGMFADPETAGLLLGLAQTHTALAALPREQAAMAEELRGMEAELSVLRRIVVEYLGEGLFDGPPDVRAWSSKLHHSLKSRHIDLTALVDARIEALGGDPDQARDEASELAENSDRPATWPKRVSTELMAHQAGMESFRRIFSQHIGHGLAFAENDAEHESARSLAQQLDEAGLNLDHEIDKAVVFFGRDARLSWMPPSHRAEAPGAGSDDPWAASAPATTGWGAPGRPGSSGKAPF
jgi:hypothetical protein